MSILEVYNYGDLQCVQYTIEEVAASTYILSEINAALKYYLTSRNKVKNETNSSLGVYSRKFGNRSSVSYGNKSAVFITGGL